MQVYVDDPVIRILAQSEQQAKLYLACLLAFWAALGLLLSWQKGEFGRAVTWIGRTAPVETPGVLTLSVPAEFVAKVAQAVDEIHALRAVAIKLANGQATNQDTNAGLDPVPLDKNEDRTWPLALYNNRWVHLDPRSSW